MQTETTATETIQNEVKPGDIFYTLWGYDQTNIDIIQVVKISASGKTAICQMSGAERGTGGGAIYNELIPNGKAYGPEFRMKIQSYQGKAELRGTYVKWDQPFRLDTFRKYESGKQLFETDSQYGH